MQRRAAIDLLVVCALCLGAPAHAEGEAPVGFPLSYRPDGGSLDVHVQLDDREVAFKKEPDPDDPDVIRGALSVGPSAGDFIGFAWNKERGRLHVDLNRNLDLTDDPAGVFESDKDWYQHFDGIGIVVTHGSVPVRYVVDMSLYQYGRHSASCTVGVRSGWEGDVTINARRWRLRVTDNLDGSLGAGDGFLLRRLPADAGAADTAPVLDRLQMGRHIFLDGRGYALAFAFDPATTGATAVVTMDPVDPALGELRLEGQFIERLVLNGQYTVVLDRPGPVVAVPAGSYSLSKVYLAGDKTNAVFSADLEAIEVHENGTVDLKVGGPLQGSIAVARAGGSLRLDYKLVGVGGREFSRTDGHRGQKPGFLVSQGGEKITSGSFEYG